MAQNHYQTFNNDQLSTIWNALLKSCREPQRSTVYGCDEARLAGKIAAHLGPEHLAESRRQMKASNPEMAWALELDI